MDVLIWAFRAFFESWSSRVAVGVFREDEKKVFTQDLVNEAVLMIERELE